MIVEPLVRQSVDVPPALAELLTRPVHRTWIDPDLASFLDHWPNPDPGC